LRHFVIGQPVVNQSLDCGSHRDSLGEVSQAYRAPGKSSARVAGGPKAFASAFHALAGGTFGAGDDKDRRQAAVPAHRLERQTVPCNRGSSARFDQNFIGGVQSGRQAPFEFSRVRQFPASRSTQGRGSSEVCVSKQAWLKSSFDKAARAAHFLSQVLGHQDFPDTVRDLQAR
jgi:hypothetical protein